MLQEFDIDISYSREDVHQDREWFITRDNHGFDAKPKTNRTINNVAVARRYVESS